jgi:hypothetical protein
MPAIAALFAAMAVLAGLSLPGIHAHTAHTSSACADHAADSDADHPDSCDHSDSSPSDSPPPHDHSSCDICKLILTGAAGATVLPPHDEFVLHAIIAEALRPVSQAAPATHFLAGLSARGPPTA